MGMWQKESKQNHRSIPFRSLVRVRPRQWVGNVTRGETTVSTFLSTYLIFTLHVSLGLVPAARSLVGCCVDF